MKTPKFYAKRYDGIEPASVKPISIRLTASDFQVLAKLQKKWRTRDRTETIRRALTEAVA